MWVACQYPGVRQDRYHNSYWFGSIPALICRQRSDVCGTANGAQSPDCSTLPLYTARQQAYFSLLTPLNLDDMATERCFELYERVVVSSLAPPHKRVDPKLTPTEKERLAITLKRI